MVWTLGEKAYSEVATVNDEADVPVLKLGTSSVIGSATITIPAGTTKIGFYAVAWKGSNAEIELKLGEEVIGTAAVSGNKGASNNSPYTINVEDASAYSEIAINAVEDAVYTITTIGKKRVIIWGLNYYTEDGIGEDQGSTEPEPEPEPEPDQPGEPIVATIADVLAAEVSTNVWYQMTGTITEIKSTTYGNFYFEDETGRIFVYGLTAAPVAKNDKSFSSLGLNVGDIVTIVGTRDRYDNATVEDQKDQVGGPAYYVSHIEGEEPEPEPEPEPEEPGQGAGTDGFEPNITWSLGTNAYDNTSTGNNCQTGVVNDVEVSNILKLGTGSKVGNATLHVPEGTTKLGFYCVAWKGKKAQLKFSIGGEEIATIVPAANVGATGNAPYTITVTDSDYYEVEMPSTDAADVQVETLDPSNGRVLIIGLQALTD